MDPDNRLVAAALEAEWNDKLRSLTDAQDDYERQRQASGQTPDQAKRAELLRLATDFPRLWRDPNTPQRDRKRMLRLLIEDVTLRRDAEGIAVQVRFKGGATRELAVDRPKPAWELRQTPNAVVSRIDALLDQHTDTRIAEILNSEGLRSGEGKPFSRPIVRTISFAYGLRPLYERLREAGLLTQAELAERLGVAKTTVKLWRRQGLLKAHAYSERNDYLYPDPGEAAPAKYKWKQRAMASRSRETTAATR